MSSASIPVTGSEFVRRKPPAAVRRKRFLVAVADHSLLIAAAIAFLAPFVFITLTALMTNGQALSGHLWPHPFRWQNFADVFEKAPFLRWTLNTMVYSTLATVGLVLSSVPVAYALARLRWRGRNAAFMIVLVALMLPPQVTVVPLYVMWAKLHLVGTLWPLIIPNWLGDAFSIFLLRQFFLTIPEEYLDAARVDGCGELRILTTVVVRLAKPAIAGFASRTTTVVRMRSSPHPSTRAASRYSCGIVMKNWRSRKIENASPKKAGTISGSSVPTQCRRTNMMYSDTEVTW